MQLGPFWALKHGSSAMAVLSEEKTSVKGKEKKIDFSCFLQIINPASSRAGSIVITTSEAAHAGGWADLAYTTSKHAALGSIRSGAALLQHSEIRVKEVSPGAVATDVGRASQAAQAAQGVAQGGYHAITIFFLFLEALRAIFLTFSLWTRHFWWRTTGSTARR